MNKLLIGVIVVAVAAVAFVTVGSASAQSPTPATPVPGTGFWMGMGGRGMRGGAQTGYLHDEMVAAFAKKLNISVDELNDRLAKGETIAQIAYSQGLTVDEFSALMSEARSQALDQAVDNGEITQEQAAWMKQRGGGRGRRGAGQGRFANPGCPYYQQTNP